MLNTQGPLFILMLLAGMGIPVMAAMNASLGANLANPFMAVAILCLVASSAAILLVLGSPTPILRPTCSLSPAYYLAGILFVFYIGSITISAPRIGLGNAVFLVILGQLFCAALIDHHGWFGVSVSQLSWKRGLGLFLIAVGVFMARSGARPSGAIGP